MLRSQAFICWHLRRVTWGDAVCSGLLKLVQASQGSFCYLWQGAGLSWEEGQGMRVYDNPTFSKNIKMHGESPGSQPTSLPTSWAGARTLIRKEAGRCRKAAGTSHIKALCFLRTLRGASL